MEHTYDSILGLIQARGRPEVSRRVANNTYAERLDQLDDGRFVRCDEYADPPARPDAVGIRLHHDYIVIFTRDERLILNHGDKLTNTTLERLNQFSPLKVTRGFPWRVCSRQRGINGWTKDFHHPILFQRDADGEWASTGVGVHIGEGLRHRSTRPSKS